MKQAITEDSLTDIVKAFAGAALDPSQWMDALTLTSETIGAVCCSLEFADLQSGAATLECPLEFDADVLRHYEERIFHINPRIRIAMGSKVGALVDDFSLLPADDPHTPEFLDWLAKTSSRYTQGSKILDEAGQVGFYNAHYSQRQGPADQSQAELHHALIPHIMNMVQIGRALSEKNLRNSLVTHHALDGGKPFGLLDQAGRLIECSCGFEMVLQSTPLLGLRNRMLVGCFPEHRALVEKFLRSAVSATRFVDRPFSIRLTGSANQRGIVLRAVPLPSGQDIFDIFRPAALVTLIDLDAPMISRRNDIALLFGLTNKEVEVAALIAEGHTIAATAAVLSISVHTVKQHLKIVFGKMCIERQSQLVATFARLGSAAYDHN